MDQIERSEEVLIALRQIIRAISIHSKKLVRNYGLTGPQIFSLKEINKYKKLPVSVLANKVSLSNATVTSILDRLAKHGYITRNKDITDRRKVLVQITIEGQKIFSKAPPLLQESFSAKFNRLEDWEQTLMISTLQRIAFMMDAKSIDAAPVLTDGDLT